MLQNFLTEQETMFPVRNNETQANDESLGLNAKRNISVQNFETAMSLTIDNEIEHKYIVNDNYGIPLIKIDNSILTYQESGELRAFDCASLCEHEVKIDRCEEKKTGIIHASNRNPIVENCGSRIQIAFGILIRLVLPLANGFARGIKGVGDIGVLWIFQNLVSSRHALTNLVAFAANSISMNLSSVQVSNRITPLLHMLKLRKTQDGYESLSDTIGIADSSSLSMPPTPSASNFFQGPPSSSSLFSTLLKKKSTTNEEIPPVCCTLNILAEPPPDVAISADIVFIHGLHGSLKNTWKQGVWANERQPVEFERPPQPPVRPLKRLRYSRSCAVYQQPSIKRAKYCYVKKATVSMDDSTFEENQDAIFTNYTYICGEPREMEISEGIEYNFPSFRLRMNEHRKHMQMEVDSMVDNEMDQDTRSSFNPDSQQFQQKQSSKLLQEDQAYSECWPGDWLPLDCPGVRVIALNYTTDQYLWRPIWKNKESRSNLIQRSREMSDLLIKHRVGFGHPIVYVGHSKGGLFIKQIIVDAWENGKTTPLWRSARGVFFYSVPHRGSHLASIKAPLLTRSVELLDIEKNNKYLLDLHRRFVGLYHLGYLKIEVFSFVETALTLMTVLYLRIVGVDSADPGIGNVCGIRLDHREICKPRSRDCLLYKELVNMIKRVC